MARFKKHVFDAGEYQSPEGPAQITPERMQHWTNQFNEMKRAGLRIPAPWSHVDTVPSDDVSAFRTKHNAGFVESFSVDKNGRFFTELDIPLEEDARRVGTVVREVSPEVRSSFIDGKGREWKDVITHVALVTLPVAPGQDNFEPISDDSATSPAQFSLEPGVEVAHFSHSTKTIQRFAKSSEGDMPFDDEDEDKKKKDSDADNDGKPDNSDAENTDDVPANELPQEPPVEPEPEPGEPINTAESAMAQERLDNVLILLSEMGMPLGGDTTPDNLLERLTVALQVKREHEKTAEPDEDDMANDKNGNGAGAAVEQQPDQLMMSLDRAVEKHPVMLGMKNELATIKTSNYNRRIDDLLHSGRCTPATAKKLKDSLGNFRMSLDAKGKSQRTELDIKLELLEENEIGTFHAPAQRFANAIEHSIPDFAGNQMSEAELDAAADELMGVKRR